MLAKNLTVLFPEKTCKSPVGHMLRALQAVLNYLLAGQTLVLYSAGGCFRSTFSIPFHAGLVCGRSAGEGASGTGEVHPGNNNNVSRGSANG
jgi:hypothetical protein